MATIVTMLILGRPLCLPCIEATATEGDAQAALTSIGTLNAAAVAAKSVARFGSTSRHGEPDAPVSLLGDLDAFYLDHRKCGDLRAGVVDRDQGCCRLARVRVLSEDYATDRGR